jgi:hypothetical protein
MSEPTDESKRQTQQDILWSYPTLALSVALWNFPWWVWFFVADGWRVALCAWTVFCVPSCICLWVTCSREPIIGFHSKYIKTYGRAIFFMSLQIAMPLISWWLRARYGSQG